LTLRALALRAGTSHFRARRRHFAGHDIDFLDCTDLAIFKAFFDRTKDWADIEEMEAVGALDHTRVLGVLADHLGGGDQRIERLRSLWNPGRET
jgi:hypothetical protein